MRFSLVAAVFFLASALFADTVILKNGQTIFGNIVGQTRTDVQINVNGQVITLQKEAIRRIQYGDNRAEIERQQKEEEARRLEAERVAREEAARRQNADVTKQKEAEQERKKKEKEADAAREAGMRRRFAIVGASAVRGFYQAAFIWISHLESSLFSRKLSFFSRTAKVDSGADAFESVWSGSDS